MTSPHVQNIRDDFVARCQKINLPIKQTNLLLTLTGLIGEPGPEGVPGEYVAIVPIIGWIDRPEVDTREPEVMRMYEEVDQLLHDLIGEDIIRRIGECTTIQEVMELLSMRGWPTAWVLGQLQMSKNFPQARTVLGRMQCKPPRDILVDFVYPALSRLLVRASRN